MYRDGDVHNTASKHAAKHGFGITREKTSTYRLSEVCDLVGLCRTISIIIMVFSIEFFIVSRAATAPDHKQRNHYTNTAAQQEQEKQQPPVAP